MANIFSIHIAIEGPQKVLFKIKKSVCSTESIFDFRVILPLSGIAPMEKWGCSGSAMFTHCNSKPNSNFLEYNFDVCSGVPHEVMRKLSLKFPQSIVLMRASEEFAHIDGSPVPAFGLLATPTYIYVCGNLIASYFDVSPDYQMIRDYTRNLER